MILSVHQFLHGYRQGHQLLASSTELSIEARKTMLFQSDLSGPTIYKGFDSYLTGYLIPDSKYYAFARTWYANEMTRPGCVWTHTLLIELADVGKLAEFASLLHFFKRPQVNSYQEFEAPLVVNLETYQESVGYNQKTYDEIATALYDFPSQSIIVAADTSDSFQNEILQIWSDQWPRLRRSFTFCTGALSPKHIRNKIFDLQIVPNVITYRQFEGSHIIRRMGVEDVHSEWLSVLHERNKKNVRQFFWVFGADIDGTRANYKKILTLYQLFTEKPSVYELGIALRQNLPNPDNGRSLKQFLFNQEKSLTFSTYDILAYLIKTDNLDYLPISEYRLTERLATAINEKQISFYDGCKLFIAAHPNRLSDAFWDLVSYRFDDCLTSIGIHVVTAFEILSHNPDYCSDPRLWQYDSRTSNFTYNWILKHYPDELPKPYLDAVLGANVGVSLMLLAHYNKKLVPDILSWSTEKHKKIPASLIEEIVKQYRPSLINWLQPRLSTAAAEILIALFTYSSNHQSLELPFSTSDWLKVLKRLDRHRPPVLPTVYTIVLSIGFQNRIPLAEKLVVRTFDTVFKLSARAQLGGVWGILPKDLDGFDEDEEYSLIEAILNLIKIIPAKKKYQIPDWDHCELLVVTYTHRFLKCGWSLQNFLDGLASQIPFERTIAYCISFRRGREFIAAIIHHLDSGNLRCSDVQRAIFNTLKNKLTKT